MLLYKYHKYCRKDPSKEHKEYCKALRKPWTRHALYCQNKVLPPPWGQDDVHSHLKGSASGPLSSVNFLWTPRNIQSIQLKWKSHCLPNSPPENHRGLKTATYIWTSVTLHTQNRVPIQWITSKKMDNSCMLQSPAFFSVRAERKQRMTVVQSEKVWTLNNILNLFVIIINKKK